MAVLEGPTSDPIGAWWMSIGVLTFVFLPLYGELTIQESVLIMTLFWTGAKAATTPFFHLRSLSVH